MIEILFFFFFYDRKRDACPDYYLTEKLVLQVRANIEQ